MKRFLLTAVLIAVVIGVMLYFLPASPYTDVYNYSEYNAVVNIYCRQTSCEAIDTGLGYQTSCSVSDFQRIIARCNGVDGVSVSFAGTEKDVQAIVRRLHADIVSVQQLDGLYVACLSASRLQGGVILEGKRVNAQIAYRNGVVTVGYPLILGSY